MEDSSNNYMLLSIHMTLMSMIKKMQSSPTAIIDL